MARTFDLDIRLSGIEPRIWRRLRVPADITLLDLHFAIQAVMWWDDYHLHVFEIAGREYGPRPEEEWERDQWAGEDRLLTAAKAFAESRGPIRYLYDFGEDWELEIALVGETTASRAAAVECLAGELAAPPEDSGGPQQYQAILHAWQAQGRRGLRREAEWLPKGFDPMVFSVEAANARLREAFRPKATVAYPAGRDAAPDQQLLARLTLAVLYLGSRETRHGTREAWKAMRTEVLETLQEAGLVRSDSTRKSVVITEEGATHAAELVARLRVLAAHRAETP